MFEIAFTADEPESQEGGWYALPGQIVLGDHRESFLAPVDFWSLEDYERHWLEAGARLLSNYACSGFFTQAFRFWWTMWREGETVFVQERFIIPELAEHITDLSVAPYNLVPERRAVTEDASVSQWQLQTRDIREFLDRQGSRPVGA